MQRRFFLWIVGLGLLISALSAASAAAAEAHLVDPAGILGGDAAWREEQEARLVAFEAKTGIRVVVEFHATSPSEEEDAGPGVYMRGVSTKLGLIDGGVLLVHFADEPDWRAWFGDALTSRWVGRPGTAAQFTADDSMHDAKEAWLVAAFEQVRVKLAEAPGPSHADALLKARLETEALVEGIISRLGTKK